MTREEAHKMIKRGLKVCHWNLNHDYLFMDEDFIIRNDKLTLARDLFYHINLNDDQWELYEE